MLGNYSTTGKNNKAAIEAIPQPTDITGLMNKTGHVVIGDIKRFLCKAKYRWEV